ncbi:MAG: hypothetical protein JJ974_04645 [Phycisphaerales bacterium]|nr:hypothetical protein [Phycisphaerales bacterium]
MSVFLKLIPSMFHRRLVLLMGVVCLGLVGLMSRMFWLTVVDGESARELAESRLIRRAWLPTTRGRVLDRTGRVLAYDQASYDVSIAYPVLSGEWAQKRAVRYARRAHKDGWDLYDDRERDAIVEKYRLIYQEHVEASLRTIAAYTGTELSELLQTREGIVARVERQHQAIIDARVRNAVEERERQGYRVTEDDRARYLRNASQKIREQTIHHSVVDRVPDAVGFELMRMTTREVPAMSYVKGGDEALEEMIPLFPGMEISDNTRRVYPFSSQAVILDRSSFPLPLRDESTVRVVVDDLGSLVLGSVRDRVFREDAQRRARALEEDQSLRERSVTGEGVDLGRYADHDRVGHTGIEYAMEHELRGLRGLRTENLQTRRSDEIDPIPGRDVRLTLDMALQARVRAILDPSVGLTRVQPWHDNEYMETGVELDAGVVVLDVATGEVLAMVSTPVSPRDGDWGRLGLTSDEEIERYQAERSPYVNRAIAKPYQPGSVAKAVVLCGAAKLGMYEQGERIEATGHLYPDRPTMLRSWIYKKYALTHYDQLGRHPDGSDALMVSSNVFFFTLGKRLGPGGIDEVYSLFGVGRSIDLGIGRSWKGSMGIFDGEGGTLPVSPEDAIQMGIGQGPVTWTPLHAADAYATIARGGIEISPRMIRTGGIPEVQNLELPSWVIRETLDGLREVVNNPEDGTGYGVTYDAITDPIFNAPGVDVWGKTGTADSSPLVIDPDGDGPMEPRMVRDGDHSWYVSLVGRSGGAPEYAIAVVVDYGGSGGRVSGAINNQIIHALVAEGYLPDSAEVANRVGEVSP